MPSEQGIGLLLPVGNPGAKVIALLRKLTPLSIAEIKARAIEDRAIAQARARAWATPVSAHFH